MIARLMNIRGRLTFVFFVPAQCDNVLEGCPVELNPRAWRRSVYRPPVLE